LLKLDKNHARNYSKNKYLQIREFGCLVLGS
jgi:hypothetical protein